MKIITLVPIKNEGWILKFSLSNFSLFSDEIILLDDDSIDESRSIASKFPKVTIIPFIDKEEIVDMSRRRKLLLEAGRKAGGTHFVWLDADEIFSDAFARVARTYMEKMQKGETMLLPWILVGKQRGKLVYNPKQQDNYKDFVFCDDHSSIFKQQFLSEARTPGDHTKKRILPFEDGCVYHFQNLAEKRNQYKQAWYRINEFLKGERGPRKINATYDYTKDLRIKNPKFIEDAFIQTHFLHIAEHANYEFYKERILFLFKEKGVEVFEPLDIWYLQELQDFFFDKTGRKPKSKCFPRWILILNDFKNRIKNIF